MRQDYDKVLRITREIPGRSGGVAIRDKKREIKYKRDSELDIWKNSIYSRFLLLYMDNKNISEVINKLCEEFNKDKNKFNINITLKNTICSCIIQKIKKECNTIDDRVIQLEEIKKIEIKKFFEENVKRIPGDHDER